MDLAELHARNCRKIVSVALGVTETGTLRTPTLTVSNFELQDGWSCRCYTRRNGDSRVRFSNPNMRGGWVFVLFDDVIPPSLFHHLEIAVRNKFKRILRDVELRSSLGI